MKKYISIVLFFIIIAILFGCNKIDNLEGKKLIFNDNKALVKQNGKWFKYDRERNEFKEYKYKEVTILQEGELYYLVNEDGEKIFTQGYQYLQEDSETGLFWAVEVNKVGLINSKGNIISEIKFHNYTYNSLYEDYEVNCSFSEGYAIVKINNLRYGILDMNGNIIDIGIYEKVENFYHGLAIVTKDNYHFGCINTKGELVIDLKYTSIYYKNDYIIANEEGVFTIFNNAGEAIIENLEFHVSEVEVNNHYIIIHQVAQDNNNIIFYDLNGDIVYTLPASNRQNIYALFNYLVIVEDLEHEENYELTILYDREEIVTFKVPKVPHWLIGYEVPTILFNYHKDNLKILYFEDKTLHIFNEEVGEFSSINFSEKYKIINYHNGLIVAMNEDHKIGVINSDGEIILDFVYRFIDIYDDGIIVLDYVNDKYGIFDYEGQEILSPTYDKIDVYYDDEIQEVYCLNHVFE